MKSPKKKYTPATGDWPAYVLSLFQDHPRLTFKVQDIERTLQVGKKDRVALHKQLRDLVRSGEIIKLRQNQYALAAPAAEVTGELRVNSQGYGFVRLEDEQEIFISPKNMGHALHKDTVRVRLLAGKMGEHPEGRVLQVVERGRTKIVGTFHRARRYAYVVPDDIKIQKDILLSPADTAELVEGQKLVVTIEAWEHDQLNPLGKVVEILGHPEDPGVDVASIVHGFDLETTFSAEVTQAAEELTEALPAEEIARRVDLRNTVTFTIDPADAKDFDDAVSLEAMENGHWLLGVHIADVSYFVAQGSLIDREAQQRGTSIYLVDRVIPMLPERLSNKLCSLTPGDDKLCFSVLMQVTRQGEVVSHSFARSVIRSRKRFSYEEAQQVLDGQLSSPFSDVLRDMWTLSKSLIAARKKRGAVDFDSLEIKVVLDEQGKPIKLHKRERLDTHRLIEEFMLLANVTVARFVGQELAEKLDQQLPFVYRVHDKPTRTDVEELMTLAQVFGVEVQPAKRVTPHYFQRLSEQFQTHPAATVLQNALLRTMTKAKYTTANVGHFGLAYSHYTHFTSPIRRYPDLMVHRLLHLYQTKPEQPVHRSDLERQCQLASENEIRAQEAERASIKMKQLEFLEAHIGEEFSGFISRIVSFGLFVTLPDFLIDGLVHISDLKDDYYIHEPKKAQLTGERRGTIYRLGDPVRIVISRINRNERLLDFALIGKLGSAKKNRRKKK
ncbi:ribonuclease R [bacterium]|nr:ribonuclease R [bacterium]